QLSARSSEPSSDRGPLKSRPSWQDSVLPHSEPDSGLLVTHVNQTLDLLRVRGRRAGASEGQASEEWLSNHSLESAGLTISHLLTQGKTVVAAGRGARSQMEFSTSTIEEFESRLFEMIELYHRRMSWLMEGSRKCLLDEQLCYKKQLYLLSFGTQESLLWDSPRDVNLRRLHQARQWVQQLGGSGGCNLLGAVKKALGRRDLSSLLVVLGSCPDQPADVLLAYVEQCLLGRTLPVHAVAYDNGHPMTHMALKNLAEASGGRFHCYSSDRQGAIYSSSDIALLQRETQKAVDLLSKIKEMRQGLLGDMLVSVIQKISLEVAELPPSHFLPKPPNHCGPLSIERQNFLPKTSADWLKSNGLKAKKLSLYQVLAPNAYSLLEEFVPVLRKTVTSTLHEKAMVQFEWHDGTVKNVHVDPPLLYNYQKQLAGAVLMLERRVEWLTTGSRQIWGNVCEQRQELWFGTEVQPWNNEMATPTLENLQDAWKWVLGLKCAGSRNVLGALRRAVEVDLQGSLDEPQGIYLFTSGVPDQERAAVCGYVSECCAGGALRLHVCLFSAGGSPLPACVPPRFATPPETADTLRDLAHSGQGRFHWFRETGIVESDDIAALMAETERAVSYSQKCALLVESLTQRAGRKQLAGAPEDQPQQRGRGGPLRLAPPTPAALSLGRMRCCPLASVRLLGCDPSLLCVLSLQQAKEGSPDDSAFSQKALTWRPTSVKSGVPPVCVLFCAAAEPGKSRTLVDTEAKQKKRPKVSQSVFYTEDGNSVGMIFKKYPKSKSVRKSIPFVSLPKEEEICSTKQWLRRFGIRKLKLDLHQLVSGPDCTHQKKLVPAVQKRVSAKYCAIFPSVQVNGVVRHLQFTARELEEYSARLERVLRRYVQRMQWLLAGSRRLFGAVLEGRVCILVDTSGSMEPCLPQVKQELASLIWEQLHRGGVSFALLGFSDRVAMWRPALAEPTEEACHDAVQWASQLVAHGSTCTLEAIQAACELGDTLGIYLLSDGKPDSSCSLVLRETARLTAGKDIAVHTISFNCCDSAANAFLRKLAQQTGGRFHRCHGDVDAHRVAHRMLTEGFTDEDDPVLPAFEGDDLRMLMEEIGKARRFLTQARAFRALLLEKQKTPDSQDDVPANSQPQARSARRPEQRVRGEISRTVPPGLRGAAGTGESAYGPGGVSLRCAATLPASCGGVTVTGQGQRREERTPALLTSGPGSLRSRPAGGSGCSAGWQAAPAGGRALVTGGAGYFGCSLGRALASSGVSVVLLDLHEPRWEIPAGAEFQQSDIRDYDALYKACEGVDCVFHTASYGMSGPEQLKKEQIESVNVGGTNNVINVCLQRSIPRLVYTSTVNVVFAGSPIEQGDEETVPCVPLDRHVDHYSKTKAIADQAVLVANGRTLRGGGLLRTCVLRPPGIYGPEERRHLQRVAVNIERRLFSFSFGDREAKMNWVHVDNLVMAHVLAAEGLTAGKGFVASGQAYYINDGESVNLFEWLTPLFEKLGYSRPLIHLPVSLVYAAVPVPSLHSSVHPHSGNWGAQPRELAALAPAALWPPHLAAQQAQHVNMPSQGLQQAQHFPPCSVFLVMRFHSMAILMECLHVALRPVVGIPLLFTRNEVRNIAVTHTFRIDKARRQLGFTPQRRDLAEAVDGYLKTRTRGPRRLPACLRAALLLGGALALLVLLSRVWGELAAPRSFISTRP
ncbi:VWA3A protein, partial [Atractosteus spatula]|nr:VWA3A protein [Atractosteus spatula]